jgi:Mg2+ and Co2+ transporter CorA
MHVHDRFDPEQVRAYHARGEFFWLDLDAPPAADLDALGALIEIPRLALDDTRELRQHAKVDDYGDRLLIVFYGTEGRLGETRLFELHMHLSGRELVTVHRGPCPPLQVARDAHIHTDREIVYRTLDALSESTLDTLRGAERDVVALEQRAFERPSAEDRRQITRWRGDLSGSCRSSSPSATCSPTTRGRSNACSAWRPAPPTIRSPTSATTSSRRRTSSTTAARCSARP